MSTRTSNLTTTRHRCWRTLGASWTAVALAAHPSLAPLIGAIVTALGAALVHKDDRAARLALRRLVRIADAPVAYRLTAAGHAALEAGR